MYFMCFMFIFLDIVKMVLDKVNSYVVTVQTMDITLKYVRVNPFKHRVYS